MITIIGLSAQQEEKDAAVLRFDNIIGVGQDGEYEYAYETSNGIKEEVQGQGGKFAKGFFEYNSPEGPVRVDYVADEEGFKPVSDSIPTPHPAVAKAIEYLRNNLPKV